MTGSERFPRPDVTLCPGGPMLVRGVHTVVDDVGNMHATTRPVSAVCRCGHTSSAPWCDGTHKVARTRNESGSQRSTASETVVRTVTIDGLQISYDQRVLEPRPWTAAQSRWASSLLPFVPAGPVLELCAGAGHIGLLAVRDHDRDLVMVDADEHACEYARHNAQTARMADRVTVRCGPMQDVLEADEQFPLIIADPPWVPSDQVDTYPEDPHLAIDGGATGLDLVKSCLELVSAHLAEDGVSILQVGPDGQTDRVAEHLVRHPELRLGMRERRLHARGALALLVRPA